jgi:carbamoyltransferase
MSLVAGIGGQHGNACVALASSERLLSVCPQERVTRVAAAGANPGGLPDEALDLLLRRQGRTRADLTALASVEPGEAAGMPFTVLEHHFAHACASFLASPFERATIVICDHEAPEVSVWRGAGQMVEPVEWPWEGLGPSNIYSMAAAAFGFRTRGAEQRLEALARLEAAADDGGAPPDFAFCETRIDARRGWQEDLAARVAGRTRESSAALAQRVQRDVGRVLLDLLGAVRARVPGDNLCLGGALFFNTALNSRAKQESGFREVFVPVNPGNAGTAVGSGLYVAGTARGPVSPFAGPAFTSEEIKAVLDNCKLTYDWRSEPEILSITVDALRKGRMVAWYEGPMEWGARALGARSILADPFSPFVLENLNRYLKQREGWRGYALAGPLEALPRFFKGPAASPYMECDFQPADPETFRHVVPGPRAAVRVQSVDAAAPGRFRRLLDAFGRVATGPFLVNTSFNAFQEPIVCSPRDAIRVFFGTGADLLVLDEFVVAK